MTTETNELDSRYTGKGVGGTGLGLGIAGTALGLLNGGLGLFGGKPGVGPFRPDCVSREEFEMGSKLAAKDAQIADLKAEMKDEKKMVEIYTTLANKISEVNGVVAANRDRADDRLASAVDKLNCKIDFNKGVQDGINAQQLAYNGTNSATIACLQNQVTQLQGMTKLVIPNSSVCPGWGAVTITPSTLSA